MARKSKIEELGLESFVEDLLFEHEDMPHTEIAALCSNKSETSISNMAIKRYLVAKNDTTQRKKREVVVADRRKVLKTVTQELDIIQTNLDTTKRLIERFKLVNDLPELFKEQMDTLIERLAESGEDWNYAAYIEGWQGKFETELRRKVGEIAILNREVRENMKFIVTLREKAFQFELVQEYIRIFMELFEEESKDGAYERAVVRIASNPRMRQLADQQKMYSGGE